MGDALKMIPMDDEPMQFEYWMHDDFSTPLASPSSLLRIPSALKCTSRLASSTTPCPTTTTRKVKFEDWPDESDDSDGSSESSWTSSLYASVREEAHNQGVF